MIETDYELPNAPVLAAKITSCLADIHHMITSVLVILRPGSIPMSTQGKITEKKTNKPSNTTFIKTSIWSHRNGAAIDNPRRAWMAALTSSLSALSGSGVATSEPTVEHTCLRGPRNPDSRTRDFRTLTVSLLHTLFPLPGPRLASTRRAPRHRASRGSSCRSATAPQSPQRKTATCAAQGTTADTQRHQKSLNQRPQAVDPTLLPSE